MTYPNVDNTEDILDSRDIIARIDELESYAIDEESGDFDPEQMDEFDRAEYDALRTLAEQGENYAADWHHGETLIRESYFADYMREYVVESGYLPADAPEWLVIDWEATADNLIVDYSDIDFDGVTYWVR